MVSTAPSTDLLPTGKQAALLLAMCDGWRLCTDSFHFALMFGERGAADWQFVRVYKPTVDALRRRGLIAPPRRAAPSPFEVWEREPWAVTAPGREVGVRIAERRRAQGARGGRR